MKPTMSNAKALSAPAIALAVALLGSGSSRALAQEDAAQTTTPLVIARQGSFFVGGETIFTRFGNDGQPDSRFNPGHATINQMYVQFQIPAHRRYKYPIVLFHGGGHSGKVFETTPDGREGWNTIFLRQGFAVYVVDAANRGRSG